MNKVQKLVEDIGKYRKKKFAQIERIQKKCKHKNTERWSDYGGINEQCKYCDFYVR